MPIQFVLACKLPTAFAALVFFDAKMHTFPVKVKEKFGSQDERKLRQKNLCRLCRFSLV